jgi:hypothetical protein
LLHKAAFAAGGLTLNNNKPKIYKPRKERGQIYQKQPWPSNGNSLQKCKVCDGFYPLSKCWYAFSNMAPDK